ncbi:MFS transporter [Rhodocyclus tenuis]|uniref:Na+/melibiose symporter-like transporter n=1 Tax=Rhodocyclus tenuis TaxID=1066 RepID=A0A840GD88_RHOTE|nr:MFS transporter [Rhodocyclus tenuis]MBB4248830.1 Na+/melibiose symporter-like transporter [Rhodocyclus tenuis]
MRPQTSAPVSAPRQAPLAAWLRRLAYGALGLPLAMAALPIYVHAPRLWAESTGMSLGLLGGLLLATRLLDAVIDPLLGAWADRVGSRRRLIVLALPFLAAGFVALLHPPADGNAVLWLLAALLTTYFGFSLASIAYQAWGAEIGADSAERTRLVACREGFGLVGVVLAAALPGILAGGDGLALADGLAQLAWLFPPLLLLLAALTLTAAPSAIADGKSAGTAVDEAAPADTASTVAAAAVPLAVTAHESVLASLRRPLADARFRRLLAVFVVNGVAAALPATLVLFFVADILQAAAWSGAFLGLYFVSGVVFLPLWVALARRIGRVAAWSLAMATACAAFVWAAGLGAGDVWPFAVVCVLSGAAFGADLALPAALLADIARGPGVAREETAGAAGGRAQGADGENAAGAGAETLPVASATPQAGGYFGWWNLVGKLNLALAAGVALPLLELAGYRPGVSDAAALSGLVVVYCGLPILFKTLAAALAWRWRNSLEKA